MSRDIITFRQERSEKGHDEGDYLTVVTRDEVAAKGNACQQKKLSNFVHIVFQNNERLKE